MSFTKINSTQNAFLHLYLRGNGKTLTENQARNLFGIKNLRARLSELRFAGLQVRSSKTASGVTAYSISARDVNGSKRSLVSKN